MTSNLRLVHWVVREFRYAALDYEDIVQEGSKGLIRAVEMFDPDPGYRFSGPLCVFGVCARARRKGETGVKSSLSLTVRRAIPSSEDVYLPVMSRHTHPRRNAPTKAPTKAITVTTAHTVTRVQRSSTVVALNLCNVVGLGIRRTNDLKRR